MDRPYIEQVTITKAIQDAYVQALPVIQYLQEYALSFTSDVTFFVGENGTGKSTLLEAIAIAYGFNAEGGTKNFAFSTNQTHSSLHESLTLSRTRYAKDGFFLRAESFYNVASNIDEMQQEELMGSSIMDSYGKISLHQQSHGESFLSLIQHRFGGHGLYILDEPEAALSPIKLMTLLKEIHDLCKQDSQFIIATHSPILMTYPGAQIFQMNDTGVQNITYEECEHYQITKQFLDDPKRMLTYLLEEDT